MSRLFIELYFDEDVDVLIAQLLRARGFVVITTQEAGQLRNSDAEQLAPIFPSNPKGQKPAKQLNSQHTAL